MSLFGTLWNYRVTQRNLILMVVGPSGIHICTLPNRQRRVRRGCDFRESVGVNHNTAKRVPSTLTEFDTDQFLNQNVHIDLNSQLKRTKKSREVTNSF